MLEHKCTCGATTDSEDARQGGAAYAKLSTALSMVRLGILVIIARNLSKIAMDFTLLGMTSMHLGVLAHKCAKNAHNFVLMSMVKER